MTDENHTAREARLAEIAGRLYGANLSETNYLLTELASADKRANAPIDMILFCPACGLQHVDEPDDRTVGWLNPPHRSHLCHGCKHIWRPADIATNGVREIATKGKADSLPVSPDKRAGEMAGLLREAARDLANMDGPTTCCAAISGRPHEPDCLVTRLREASKNV